jgi:tRNA threonylcarbamoyladenosine biosynthesis protein TsaE
MRLLSGSVAATIKIGRAIARHARKGDIVCLSGQLGAGKTVLTKGIAAGLGIAKNKLISPTFVLIREYPHARLPLYHFDLYRLNTPSDILVLGYEEYFYDDGLTVVEWAERLKYLLPAEYLKIELRIRKDKKRLLVFEAAGSRYRRLLKEINEDTGG